MNSGWESHDDGFVTEKDDSSKEGTPKDDCCGDPATCETPCETVTTGGEDLPF